MRHTRGAANDMISALMLVISVAALGQFWLAYCRSLVSVCGPVQISRQMREAVAPEVGAYRAGEFRRLVGLLRYAPAQAGSVRGLAAVSCYYRALAAAKWAVAPASAALAHRIERELARCTYFAAVSLDRCFAPSAS